MRTFDFNACSPGVNTGEKEGVLDLYLWVQLIREHSIDLFLTRTGLLHTHPTLLPLAQ